MNRGIRILATLGAAALALVGWAVPAAVATGWHGPTPTNPQSTTYWEAEYDNAVACYYSKGNTSHGRVVKDGAGNHGVKLATFQKSWPGDRWEVVIVGGNGDYREYATPDAGTFYGAPDDARVSYWIVCKGKAPQEDKFKPYTTYVCWEIISDDYDLKNGRPIINEKWFNPPQEFVSEGDSFGDIRDCYDYVADCGVPTTWYQLDQYVVKSKEHHRLLEDIKKNGLGWHKGPQDSPLVNEWEIHGVTSEECAVPEPEPTPEPEPEPEPVPEPEPEPEPTYEYICVWDSEANEPVMTPVESIGNEDIAWENGEECIPPSVTICVQDGDNWVGQSVLEEDLPAEYLPWTGDPEDCFTTPPSLEGTTSVGICVDGVPYLDYAIALSDPDAQISDTAKQGATVTFLHPTNPELDHEISLDLDGNSDAWSGSVLWPGASINPPAWPGWDEIKPGVFVPVGDDNFGWTRDGVSVEVAIDPELTFVNVLYPDSDPVCDTPPPVDICVWDGGKSHQVTIYGELPEGATPWNGDVPGGGCKIVEVGDAVDEPGNEEPVEEEPVDVEEEDDEFTIVLGAPPLAAPVATPVAAEATYTG